MDANKPEEPKSFSYHETDFIWKTQAWADENSSEVSAFDKELRSRWDVAMANGMFHYDVDHTVTRILPGTKHYVCQLNTKRNVIRRQPQAITSVGQPFNHSTFNFTKVSKDEILFDLKKKAISSSDGDTRQTQLDLLQTTGHAVNGFSGEFKEDQRYKESNQEDTTASHSMIINVSPMEYGHSILVPYRDSCIPQVLTRQSLTLALETVLLSKHRGLTVGFNSLCANASVNHLHFHFLYLEREIVASHCTVTPLMGQVFEVTSLALPGFALQLHGSSIVSMATLAHGICSYLHQNEIAHNVLICRGTAFGEERGSSRTTVRLFVWPRQKYMFGSEDAVSFYVACFELGGYLTTFDESSYNRLTEGEVDDIISAKRLEPSCYETIRKHATKIARET